jgi:hypothetical protein
MAFQTKNSPLQKPTKKIFDSKIRERAQATLGFIANPVVIFPPLPRHWRRMVVFVVHWICWRSGFSYFVLFLCCTFPWPPYVIFPHCLISTMFVLLLTPCRIGLAWPINSIRVGTHHYSSGWILCMVWINRILFNWTLQSASEYVVVVPGEPRRTFQVPKPGGWNFEMYDAQLVHRYIPPLSNSCQTQLISTKNNGLPWQM